MKYSWKLRLGWVIKAPPKHVQSISTYGLDLIQIYIYVLLLRVFINNQFFYAPVGIAVNVLKFQQEKLRIPGYPTPLPLVKPQLHARRPFRIAIDIDRVSNDGAGRFAGKFVSKSLTISPTVSVRGGIRSQNVSAAIYLYTPKIVLQDRTYNALSGRIRTEARGSAG